MKVLILSSLAWSLINFRGALIEQMARNGHDVIAGAPDEEPEVVARLAEMGVGFRLTPMARAGTNPVSDLATLYHYVRLLRDVRPDVVIAYTQKPIIYGGLATRLAGWARFYAIMSGLGYVYSSAADDRVGLRKLVSRFYRSGLRKAECVFVFNGDDRRMLMDNGITSPGQTIIQVPGSGIDIRHFAQQPMPKGPTTFLMMGRLMRDKGVGEYVAAARVVREHWPDTRFLLLGRPETENPTGYSADDIRRWQDEGLIELLAETRDVRPYLGSAHVFVLPSFYREGLPRTILEALATGRPVITTDLPGCREPIRPGENGLLVPPQDAAALARAMAQFVEAPALCKTMGRAARETAVDIYDVDKVNRMLLETMNLDGRRPAGRADAPSLSTPAVANA